MVSALLAAHHVTHESPPPLSHRTPYPRVATRSSSRAICSLTMPSPWTRRGWSFPGAGDTSVLKLYLDDDSPVMRRPDTFAPRLSARPHHARRILSTAR